MATITPSWTQNNNTVALATLSRNSVSRTELDLRSKWGAWLHPRIGRGGTNAMTNGINVLVRRLLDQAGGKKHPAVAAAGFLSQSAAAVSTTCAASGNNAGVTSLTVASTTSFAVGDLICVQDGSLAATEWCRVARITSSTVLLLDAPTEYAHNDITHTVRNKADAWSLWVDGGAYVEIIFDYGDDAAGDTATIECRSQTLDAYSSV